MNIRKLIVILLLLAVPVLVGAKCAFFFSTGDDSSDSDDEDKDKEEIVVASGRLSGTPIEGADYSSGSFSGTTGSNGEYQYEIGTRIRFSIGDIPLGEEVEGRTSITLADLTGEESTDATAAVNLLRLLYSLDASPGDDAITIPAEVRMAATRANESISAAIEYLDFSDEQGFVNAASQLVAVLTEDYPFTAVLVGADTVRERMRSVDESPP